jgi:ATP-dependent DNA helicase PIF1
MPNGSLSREKLCRFYFERLQYELAVLSREMNPQYEMFDGARPNDGRMNNYIRGIALGWLANTDAPPCTSLRAVLNYIAKYCSKAEKQTQPYKEMISELIPMVNNSRPMVSLVAKMMNKLIGERDWPAMEVSHLLLDLPLTECSHVIQPVDCRDPRKQVEAAIISPDREISDVKSLHQKYCQRDIELGSLLTLIHDQGFAYSQALVALQ